MSDDNKLVPTRIVEGELVTADNASIQVKMQNQMVSVPVPKTLDDWTPIQRAVILKSTPQWASYEVAYIMFVDAWSQKRGLDLFGGNVYIIEGKPSTSDEAKISNAMRTGRVEYLTVSDVTPGTNPITGQKDFYAEATLKLAGESKERKYKAWMSEWKNPKNANWTKNPTDSLQRKAMARVCHFAVPMGTESEDFLAVPTADPASIRGQVQRQLAPKSEQASPVVVDAQVVGQSN